MKKNELKQGMLLAVLLLGLGSACVSCSDDDKDEKELTPEEQEAKNQAEDLTTMAFWRVAGQLCSGCDETADWQAARLEANIGEPSQQSDATRLVLVNNAEAALSHFSGLIGTELPDYTVSYDWTLDGAGSMTYRKQTDGTAWASVDVNLKQLPGLKRLVYCSPEQQGLNARFDGTAYYRFGDVIRKKNADGNWEYWMCVRPMFGAEKKQDMHWVSLSDLPSKNVLKYEASTGDSYYLPTKLSGSYHKVHWQNAAEMLFAILHPEQWSENLTNNKKLEFFNDFSRENMNYHNQYFWKRVQDGWQNHNLFQEVLHFDKATLESEMQKITFIYYGYSWYWTLNWNLELWAYEYSGMDNNFHTAKYIVKKENVKGKPFDVHKYGQTGKHEGGYEPFPVFTYPCRYVKGKDLAGFKPTEYLTIKSATNGIEEVYVYNKEYGIDPTPQTEPEVCEPVKGKLMANVTKEDIGKLLAKNGKIYDDATTAERDGTTAVAMIVATKEDNYRITDYQGNDADASELTGHARDSYDMLKNALAISLDYWRNDVYNNSSIVGDDFGESGNYPSNDRYVSSNGLGQWNAATTYYWMRAIAGCGGDAEIWTYTNMLYRYQNEVGQRQEEKYPRKDCTKLVELLKKHHVELDMYNGKHEVNLLRDGSYYKGAVYRWIFELNPDNPDISTFMFFSTLSTEEKRLGVFRPFYVW